MSIDPDDLDLTEDQAEFLLDFHYRTMTVVRSSAALGILMAVSRDTVLRGDCRTSHKQFGRLNGKCRRSVDTAIKLLKGHHLIERVGTTEAGGAIYRANFDAECARNEVE